MPWANSACIYGVRKRARTSNRNLPIHVTCLSFIFKKKSNRDLCIWMWIKNSSELPWHWIALVFCLYEFGNPHSFKGPPLTATGTNQVLLAPRRLYVSIMRSVLPEDKSGNPGTERILRNPSNQSCVGGRGLSHISWRDVFVLSTVMSFVSYDF